MKERVEFPRHWQSEADSRTTVLNREMFSGDF